MVSNEWFYLSTRKLTSIDLKCLGSSKETQCVRMVIDKENFDLDIVGHIKLAQLTEQDKMGL